MKDITLNECYVIEIRPRARKYHRVAFYCSNFVRDERGKLIGHKRTYLGKFRTSMDCYLAFSRHMEENDLQRVAVLPSCSFDLFSRKWQTHFSKDRWPLLKHPFDRDQFVIPNMMECWIVRDHKQEAQP